MGVRTLRAGNAGNVTFHAAPNSAHAVSRCRSTDMKPTVASSREPACAFLASGCTRTARSHPPVYTCTVLWRAAEWWHDHAKHVSIRLKTQNPNGIYMHMSKEI